MDRGSASFSRRLVAAAESKVAAPSVAGGSQRLTYATVGQDGTVGRVHDPGYILAKSHPVAPTALTNAAHLLRISDPRHRS
jgi:hypothetical protein